jgi:hypothetical protein
MIVDMNELGVEQVNPTIRWTTMGISIAAETMLCYERDWRLNCPRALCGVLEVFEKGGIIKHGR